MRKLKEGVEVTYDEEGYLLFDGNYIASTMSHLNLKEYFNPPPVRFEDIPIGAKFTWGTKDTIWIKGETFSWCLLSNHPTHNSALDLHKEETLEIVE